MLFDYMFVLYFINGNIINRVQYYKFKNIKNIINEKLN